MSVITTIGLDLAKNVFQVHGVDAEGKVQARRLGRSSGGRGLRRRAGNERTSHGDTHRQQGGPTGHPGTRIARLSVRTSSAGPSTRDVTQVSRRIHSPSQSIETVIFLS
ncbi:hypothetical protein [Roseomonas mucosa]